MRRFTINGLEITEQSLPYIIAEVGNNTFLPNDHDRSRSIELCKALITRAASSGASAVKLQKRNPKTLYTSTFYDKPYTGQNSFGPTYGTHREALEFDEKSWEIIINHAKTEGILLFATPFDKESISFLRQFDMPAYKVASGCIRDIPLIKQLASLSKPLIISTGGAEWDDVDRVYSLLGDIGTPFCFLHCTMQYPCAAENVNLRIIEHMRLRYPAILIGFSDHTIGTWAIPAAYQSGAMIFEKHFTSNRALPGPDHALSIEPDEMQGMIHTLSRIHAARGTVNKTLFQFEQDNYMKMGKGVYSAREIARGTVITANDLCIKSPAIGAHPYQFGEFISKRLKVDVGEEHPMTKWDVEENR
jgi:sialic acid synthase